MTTLSLMKGTQQSVLEEQSGNELEEERSVDDNFVFKEEFSTVSGGGAVW